eukprot:c26419_g1_i1 orf=391-738(-)
MRWLREPSSSPKNDQVTSGTPKPNLPKGLYLVIVANLSPEGHASLFTFTCVCAHYVNLIATSPIIITIVAGLLESWFALQTTCRCITSFPTKLANVISCIMSLLTSNCENDSSRS